MAPKLQSDDFVEHALSRHGDAVFRLALNQLRSAADAQDVVQDTFIRLLTHETAFHDENHLRAWLLRVALNRCRDLQRSAWNSKVDALDEQTGRLGLADRRSKKPTPEEAVVSQLEYQPLWQALEALPEKLRVVMHLRYVENLDDAEIANIIGTRPTTVRTRLFRARNQLRSLLEHEYAPAATPQEHVGGPAVAAPTTHGPPASRPPIGSQPSEI